MCVSLFTFALGLRIGVKCVIPRLISLFSLSLSRARHETQSSLFKMTQKLYKVSSHIRICIYIIIWPILTPIHFPYMVWCSPNRVNNTPSFHQCMQLCMRWHVRVVSHVPCKPKHKFLSVYAIKCFPFTLLLTNDYY